MKKLRNKKTGDIGFLICVVGPSPEKIKVVECIDGKRGSKCWYYDTITELNEEWEDAPEEPKEFWFIGEDCCPHRETFEVTKDFVDRLKEIGNYFETKEEAEKVVEKLKAWKRLKDKGLVIKKWRHTPDTHLTTGSFLKIEGFIPAIMKNINDLDLLFGGEE